MYLRSALALYLVILVLKQIKSIVKEQVIGVIVWHNLLLMLRQWAFSLFVFQIYDLLIILKILTAKYSLYCTTFFINKYFVTIIVELHILKKNLK